MRRKIGWALLGSILLVGCFYWYEIRPVIIRSSCSHQALEKATLKREVQKPLLIDSLYDSLGTRDKDIFDSEDYKTHYNICLNEKGLK